MKVGDCKQASSPFLWARFFLSLCASSLPPFPPPRSSLGASFSAHRLKNSAGGEPGMFSSLKGIPCSRQRQLMDRETPGDRREEKKSERITREWGRRWVDGAGSCREGFWGVCKEKRDPAGSGFTLGEVGTCFSHLCVHNTSFCRKVTTVKLI